MKKYILLFKAVEPAMCRYVRVPSFSLNCFSSRSSQGYVWAAASLSFFLRIVVLHSFRLLRTTSEMRLGPNTLDRTQLKIIGTALPGRQLTPSRPFSLNSLSQPVNKEIRRGNNGWEDVRNAVLSRISCLYARKKNIPELAMGSLDSVFNRP